MERNGVLGERASGRCTRRAHALSLLLLLLLLLLLQLQLLLLLQMLQRTRRTGSALRMCSSSWSVQVEGSSRPRLLPAVTRPMKRQPAIEACTTGICSASSASKML